MSRAPPPSGLQDHLGYWLRLVSNAVSLNFARAIEREGVTVAEWVFLRILYDADPVSPSQLADRMGMTRGAISKLADRLVDKSLVLRTAHATDARAHALSLTPSARALVPRLSAVADANDTAFFEGLAADEREQFRSLLQKIALARELTKVPVD